MTVLVTNPQERKRFLKFMVVGVIGAVVDFGIWCVLGPGLSMCTTVGGDSLIWPGGSVHI